VEVAGWQQRHNAVDQPIDWQFTTDDVRIKLRQLRREISEITFEATQGVVYKCAESSYLENGT
jgi:hypothetical protein